MATVHDQFVGAADETTYATGVAPDNFFEVVSEDVSGVYERIESEAIRGAILREDRFAPNPKGAEGSLEIEVKDKGFDFWLKHMLGAVSVATGTHTATLGSLSGTSFTYQAARYASELDTLIPFSYHGGKVAEWELSCEVDAIVKANLTLDFATEVINGSGADALATPVYPTGAQLLTFIGGSVSVDSTEFPVSAITLSGSNGLKRDRYSLRGAASTSKREPKAEEMQEITFDLTGEFEDDTHSQRVASALASGAVASLDLHFDSPQGGTLDVSLPVGRFDEAAANIARNITEQGVTGKVLAPADGSEPITVTYVPAV